MMLICPNCGEKITVLWYEDKKEGICKTCQILVNKDYCKEVIHSSACD